MEIKKINDNVWEFKEKGMDVPVRVFASEDLLAGMKKDRCLEQAGNVAKLPGILKASLVMPDAHQGYGFSIGGVAGFDLDKGVVSPGGVGYDINCGVRVLLTNLTKEDFMKKQKQIVHDFARSVPSGVGRGHQEKQSEEILEEVMVKGAEWAVENGFGVKEDLERCEESGKMKGANPKDVSQRARARGRGQLGTLGAGNHFLEVQEVDEVFDKEVAEKFGLKKGQIVVMIHCGSRGLGHQVASDYIKLMEKEYGFPEQDRELIHAPIKSDLGKKYLSAMACAVNYAFCNRQMIMHFVREVLKKHFPKFEGKLLYDVAHNVAKFEEHDGKKICVHRKGATRSFGEGRKELPVVYRKTGQPVIIPGSMGTASYILKGTKEAEKLSFGSTAHGAGRKMSRSEAIRKLKSEKVKSDLEKKGIYLEAGSSNGVSEEAPEAYKDVDEVVRVSDSVGLGKLVVRLKPLGVLKG